MLDVPEYGSRTDLVLTKVQRPAAHQFIIPRARLHDKLNRAFWYKLAALTAPAGYGKTTAVLSWLQECRLPVAWYSIDSEDNDPVRFWRYFIRALDCGLQHSGIRLSEITVNKDLIRSNELIELLISHLTGACEKAIIILDDYHFIQDPVIHKSVAAFIKNLPPNFITVILSRSQLNPEFEALYVRGQILRLDNRDLAFTPDEISSFFMQQGLHLDETELKKIQAETEGWVAGMVVTAIAMTEEREYLLSGIRLPAVNRHIEKFLQEQIFSPAPGEVKKFLTSTCVTERFSASLCAFLTGFGNCEEILHRLLETNSFIIPLDHGGEWFRYHHLFHQFLKTRLKKESPSVIASLYIKAGQWFRQNGLMREAMEMFLEGGDYQSAVTVFWDLYNVLVFCGEYAVLLQWMERIPEEYHQNDVIYCSARAWLLIMENRLQEAMAWQQKAKSSFESRKSSIQDKPFRDFLEVLVLLGQADMAVRNLDSCSAARYYSQASRLRPEMKVLLGEVNNGQPGLLRTFYGFFGRLHQIEEAYASTRDQTEIIIGVIYTYTEILSAECHYERNQLDKCNETLTRILQKIYELNTNGSLVPAFFMLAKIKRASGDIKAALDIIREGKGKLATKIKDHWHYLFDLLAARIHMETGDVQKAETMMNLSHISVYDNISAIREYEYITYARYLMEKNRSDDAAFLLGRLNEFAEKEKRFNSRLEILCIIALLHYKEKRLTQALMILDSALRLGHAEWYVRTFIDEAQPMAELLTEYLREKKAGDDDPILQYAQYLLSQAAKETGRFHPAGETSFEALTNKEYQVLQLINAGHSNEEISRKLGISTRTVKYHNSNLFAKLGVKRRAEAISKAREFGLLG